MGNQPPELLSASPTNHKIDHTLTESPITYENTNKYETDNESTIEVRLISICHGRSGDKGNSVNIGIVCRSPKFYPFLEKVLTEQVPN